MQILPQILILLFQLIFGILAIRTQQVALNKQAEFVHGLAWSVEVLLSSTAFLILAVLGNPLMALTSFVLGVILILVAVALFR